MPENRERTRERFEQRFNLTRITEEAEKRIDTELETARKKTARLKALRLAEETPEGVMTEPDKERSSPGAKTPVVKRAAIGPKHRRLAFKLPLAGNHRHRATAEFED